MVDASKERSVVAVVCLALIGSMAGATLAGMLAQLAHVVPFVPVALATVLGGGVACVVGRRRLAARLPDELDGWFALRKIAHLVWMFAAVCAVVNTARISIFAMDPTRSWASAFPPVPESAKHQCLPAYVRAGELAAWGRADIWRQDRFQQGEATDLTGLPAYLGDPYEYPPPFAMLPRAAVAMTHDYQLIRDAWFGLSAVGFLAIFVALALWVRGRAGATAVLLLPVVALSTPFVFTLQFGQAHALILGAAVLGMIQLARDRTLSGAMLLAFATVTKLFPGFLLVFLAVRRRWRDLAYTLAALAALVALSALVLGPATLGAFVTEQLPRIASGEAFAFTEQNFDNLSLYGIAFKLNALGVDAGRPLAANLAWVWTVIVLALTIVAARKPGDRTRDAILWLAILCLATLRSPYAPLYTSLGTLWLFSIATTPRGWNRGLVAFGWLLLMGFPPMGGPAINALLSVPGQLVTLIVPLVALRSRSVAG